MAHPFAARPATWPPSKVATCRSIGVPIFTRWVLPCTRCSLAMRSEEHTSELQSHVNLVCRLLLEKKKERIRHYHADKAEPEHPEREVAATVQEPDHRREYVRKDKHG